MASQVKEQAVRGVAWSLVERFGMHFLRFLLNLILARLLTPDDYGLIGMLVIFIEVANVVMDGGFVKAYVQKKVVSPKDASTIFYFNLLISIILYFIFFLTAPLVADFYSQPQLIEIIKVMGLVFIIDAMGLIQIAHLTRTVNFKLKSKIMMTATLSGGVLGIAAAYYGFGVWSLVIQNLARAVIKTIGFWITSSWKPKAVFSMQSLKSMFAFGSWMLLSGIIQRLFRNLNLLVIGRVFPAAAVGFYTNSKQIQRTASEQMVGAIGAVAFPVFSKMQDNKERLRNGMRQFLRHTLFLMTPLLVILMVVAEPFVIIFLKEKWAPMVPYLQWLCIVGILFPLNSTNVQLLVAQGKSNLNFRISLIKNILRVINIAIMYRFGVLYIIIGEVGVALLSVYINSFYSNKFVGYGILRQLKDNWLLLLSAVLTFLIGYITVSSLENIYWEFVLGIAVSGVFFLVFHYLFNRQIMIEFLSSKNYLIKKKE
ncbi:MAG: lipopolysaccharide biosynthesis protein [Bacteroidales bacterium]|nr:lipopolysaccharide biosynthesis protein [Bacteroidales bacterium]